jgi:pimeloyl-ACP methyl ester carboxylesterase
VIATEHPGFGRSEIPEWMMSVGDLAFFYLDVLEALNLGPVHLVGHSLGGWLAAEIAIRNTNLIRSLSLLSPAGISVPEEPYDDIFMWSHEESARRNYFGCEFAEASLAAKSQVDVDISLQNRAGLARLAWSPRLENPQLRYWLHRIDVPTMLIWGREDRVIPYACHAAFLKEIPDARLVTLDRCGHASHTEAADRVSAELTRFFRSVSL